MIVETTKAPGDITSFPGAGIKRATEIGLTALLTVLLAVTFYANNANANKNVWMAQVQPIEPQNQSFRIANLNGPSGRQLRLRINIPANRIVPGASLTFYGLPDKIILSSGVRKSKVWIVPVASASKLTLIAPSGYTGHFESAAILRRRNGQVIEGQRFVISIQNTRIARRAAPKEKKILPKRNSETVSPSKKTYSALSVRPADKVKPQKVERKEPTIQAAPKKNTINPDLADTLLTKGKQLLKDGNIVAARETLKFLAQQGHAESANLIAKTYDPEEFKNFNAAGIEPNLKEAKKWYTIAAKLGAKEAQNRLKEYADAGL